jgi:gamma-glutamyltranspeptidase/glutathione hydrolase
MVINTVDWGLNPQASLDAPRWRVSEGLGVWLEYGMPRGVVDGLIRRGHAVRVEPDGGQFGKGQIIWRMDNGTLVAGSEPRADGHAVGW